ncbi:Piwi-domain-containing protein [Punctularia strigosozonata HHB-11173 SS5]|uniref:Piwi-domain-containing protein n=1 Tax=Punctularia strigosozonata (strain HHB-11173) TaxID=741275 RepID=UPI0004417E17|nr:Piwi-domain-containing protein [Punctularia strigosozonata HHB-11173 SS5]EIN05853.1 Piwi-domain-containing protein [Punctularia strigosozonata HHB-11173 SS5]
MQGGTQGTVMIVRTNSFVIKRMPQMVFYQYENSITPLAPALPRRGAAPQRAQAPGDTELPPRRNTEIITHLQTRTSPQSFRGTAVFDGKRTLFAPSQIPFPNGAGEFTVDMNTREPRLDRNIFKVKMKLVSTLTPSNIQRILTGGQHDGDTSDIMRMLQLILRQDATQNYPFTRKAVFPGKEWASLKQGLTIHRGYFQSVRPSLNKIIVQVDVSHSAMHRSGSVIDIAQEVTLARDLRALENLARNPNDPAWKKLCSFLKGVKIRSHMNRNEHVKAKIRPIKKLIPNAGAYEFTIGDNDPTTVNDYHRTLRGENLKYPGLFGVVVGRDTVIPAEYVEIVPGQLYQKKLPAELMKDVLAFATQRPETRLDNIVNAVKSDFLGYQGAYMRMTQMEVDPQPLKIRGRVLEPPLLIYGENSACRPDGGRWNLLNRKLVNPGLIPAWAVVDFNSGRSNMAELIKFLKALVECLRALGIRIHKVPPPILNGNTGNVEQSMEEAGRQSIQDFPGKNPHPTIIIVILPDSSADIRRAVKHWGDASRDVPTQCVNAKKLSSNVARDNSLSQYCNNIALKINVKINGVNTYLVPSPNYAVDFGGKMILGADVGHPGPGVQRPSLSSVVFSVDEHASRYGACCRVQHPRTERIADMKEMIVHALVNFNRFWGKPNSYPVSMVMYRDGLSEGEFEVVADEEIKDIKSAIDHVWAAQQLQMPKPRVTYIVVGKRHHARFFPERPQDGDRSGNVKPGLVVDEDLSSPTGFDFYLQSHGGLLGTSRPAHYTLRLNEDRMNADQLQRLTYALCYVYARATRSVSLPAPVYYADLVCGRAEFHFDRNLNYETDTVASGEGEFDLKRWKDGFHGPKSKQSVQFYFM